MTDRTPEVLELRAALRNMADAYVRRVKTGLTPDEIAKDPWRCAEYVEAERLCKTPFKLHFTKEWLLEKIKNDPDIPCEAGPSLSMHHASDCALHNAPALPVGPCDCGLAATDNIGPGYANIDEHPLRYSRMVSDIEQILMVRIHRHRLDGYVLETAIHIADAIVGTR